MACFVLMLKRRKTRIYYPISDYVASINDLLKPFPGKWRLYFNNRPRNYESLGKYTTVLTSRHFIHAVTRWNMNALNWLKIKLMLFEKFWNQN